MRQGKRRLLFFPLSMPRWKLQTTIVCDGEQMYFPVPSICRALGIKSSQAQTERITSDPLFEGKWGQYAIQTGYGIKETYCIDRDGFAMWMVKINAARVAAEVRGKLLDFQREVMAEASRLFWRELRRQHLTLLPRPTEPDADTSDPTLHDVLQTMAFIEDRLGAVEAAQIFVPDEANAPAQPGDLTLTCPHCGGKLWVRIGASGQAQAIHEEDND